MPTMIDPVVGEWFERIDTGEEFKVVAVNDDSETVELQHFDGDIEEYTFEDWYDLDLAPAVEPENFSGPYDNMSEEDMGYSDAPLIHTHLGSPLDDYQD